MLKEWQKFRKKLKLRLSFAKRRLVKPSLPTNRDGKVLVHIGCGKINSPEFINVDARAAAARFFPIIRLKPCICFLLFFFSSLNPFKGTIAFEYISNLGVIRIGSNLLFEDGVHVKYFDTAEEFFELADWYLKNEYEREKIAMTGMEKAYSEFNCERITKYMLNLIETGTCDAPWATIL